MRGFSALRSRDFRLFYGVVVLATLGMMIARTATLYHVYELTASPLHLGLLSLASGVPALVLSLAGGVIADRVDRRRVIGASQLLGGALGLGVALLTAAARLDVWHLYALALGLAVLTALANPARTALIPSLVSPEDLMSALALNSTAWRISLLVGPALAGACIAWLVLAATYSLIGLTGLATLGVLALIRLPAVGAPSRTGVLSSLLEGFSFVRAQSIVLVLYGLDAAAQFFGGYRVLLPAIAARLEVGPEGFGLLMSATAVGGLTGAAISLWLRQLPYRGLVVAGGVLAYCAGLVALALSPWYPLTLASVVLLGLADAVNAIPRNAIVQRLTPDPLRGRVASLHSTLTAGVPPMGEALSGAAAAAVGVPAALLLGAAACASVTLGLVARRGDLRAKDL